MFEWIHNTVSTSTITLYPGNLTLNSSAASYFQDVRWVMLGVDHDQNQLANRPISKREIDLHLVDQNQLHRISIGNGYARISNKTIMKQIAAMIGREVNGEKVSAQFREEETLLVFDLKELCEGVKA